MKTRIALLGACVTLAACSARAGVAIEPQVGVVASVEGSDRVWVCHRGRWQEVAAPAADAHGRHGDRVSTGRREARSNC